MSDPICAGCGKTIGDGRVFTAFSQRYHSDCFTCSKCGNKIYSFAKFFEENKKPVCADCNRSTVINCMVCAKPITTLSFMEISSKKLHEDCYVCFHCKKHFGPEGYFEADGRLWHLPCYQKK